MLAYFKSWCKRIITILLVHVVYLHAFAQETILQPEADISTGLPSNTIRALKLDKKGSLWVGTDNGLVVLNPTQASAGTMMQVFKGKSIWAIDFSDSLALIGTRVDGLYVFNAITGKKIQHFPSSAITQIRKIKVIQNKIFILTNLGIYTFNKGALLKIPYFKEVEGDFFIDIFERENNIYGIIYHTKNCFEVYQDNEFKITKSLNGINFPLYPGTFFSAASTKGNLVFAGSNESKYTFALSKDGTSFQEYKLLQNLPRGFIFWQSAIIDSFLVMAGGNVYSNTLGMLYMSNINSIEPKLPESDYVTCFEIDSLQKGLYYGTLNSGLFYKRFGIAKDLNKKEYSFETLPASLKKNVRNKKPELGVFTIGDTTIALYYKFIHIYDNRLHKTIKIIYRLLEKDTNSHTPAQSVEFFNNCLIVFDIYGACVQYPFQSNSSPKKICVTTIPYPQKYDSLILLLNKEKNFYVIRKNESFPMNINTDDNLSFINDYTLDNNLLYTLTNDYIKIYTLDLVNKILKPYKSIALSAVVNDFIPKWIDFYDNKIVLSNNQGLLFLKWDKLLIPETYFYFGKHLKNSKPFFKGQYVHILNEQSEELLPVNLLSINRDIDIRNFNITAKYPVEINEKISFDFKVQASSYLIENNFLKCLEIYKDGKLLDKKYFVHSIYRFEQGLEYGSYDFVLRIGNVEYTFKGEVILPLNRNPYFFSTIGFFIFLISGIYIKSRYDKKELNKKLLQNRMLILKQNLNPHFVYNSMNLINSLIIEKKYDDAIEVVSEFSHLQRTYLETNNKETISLKQELDFVSLYLKLQQRRFQYDITFMYSINIGEDIDVDSITLPPLLLQPLAENAIKYGILGSEALQKRITIDVKGKMPLIIGIEDNGENVERKSIYGLGLGHKLILERVALFKKSTKNKYHIRFDLPPLHSKSGYRAEIHIDES